MTQIEMKKYLGNYKRLKTRANKLVWEIERFPQDRVFLQPILKKVTDTVEDITAKISEVENTDYRELLIRKYIYGETFEEIGESMCYSSRHVQRMVNVAIASMREVTL